MRWILLTICVLFGIAALGVAMGTRYTALFLPLCAGSVITGLTGMIVTTHRKQYPAR